MNWSPTFPMPGDRRRTAEAAQVTIVASVHRTDEEALVLCLHAQPPFFSLGLTSATDPSDTVRTFSTHFNIVYAVEEYQQEGGDV